MWPKIMSSIKLSFLICYFPLWQHNRYFTRRSIKAGPSRWCCSEPHPVGVWASPWTATPHPIWAPLLLFTLMVKSFPRFSQIFPCCSWWLLPFVLLLHPTRRRLAPSLKSHQSAAAGSSMVPHHLPPLAAQMGSPASPPTPRAPAWGASLRLLQFAHVCLVQGFPNKTVEMWSALECQIDGGVPSWDLTHPGMLLAAFATKAHCWLVLNLLSNKIRVLFCFLDSHLQPVLLYEAIPSQGQGSALTFAELHEVPIRPFFILLKSLCKAAPPSSMLPAPST